MRFVCKNIRIRLEELEKTKPREAIAKKLRLKPDLITHFKITRSNIDSRLHKSSGVFFVYSALFDYPKPIKDSRVHMIESDVPAVVPPPVLQGRLHPIIVGTGPAGLFCALRLLDAGAKPILLEMGRDIPKRNEDVNRFFTEGVLSETSNVSFGLGGAGTYSDGKLYTRTKDPVGAYILDAFIKYGAPVSIRHEVHAHLGSDRVKRIVSAIKEDIEAKGGQFHFNAKVTGLLITHSNRVSGVVVNGKEEIEGDAVFLGTGNAARSVYKMLAESGVALEKKPFAVGIRIEHKQEILSRYVYGRYASHPLLSVAAYSLIYRDEKTGRGVYTFCNCPGGLVVNAASEEGKVVTNGMSFSRRSLINGNAAYVVSVKPDDCPSSSPLAMMHFQEEMERGAFALAKGTFAAPAMTLGDFLGTGTPPDCTPTILPGFEYCDITSLFPPFILDPLNRALESFNARIQGFDTGIITAPETRTSAPLRILRTKTMESISHKNLYPIGEGAGYAGGILSSAVDGIKAADAVLNNSPVSLG